VDFPSLQCKSSTKVDEHKGTGPDASATTLKLKKQSRVTNPLNSLLMFARLRTTRKVLSTYTCYPAAAVFMKSTMLAATAIMPGSSSATALVCTLASINVLCKVCSSTWSAYASKVIHKLFLDALFYIASSASRMSATKTAVHAHCLKHGSRSSIALLITAS
jgi:hypothetical protein